MAATTTNFNSRRPQLWQIIALLLVASLFFGAGYLFAVWQLDPRAAVAEDHMAQHTAGMDHATMHAEQAALAERQAAVAAAGSQVMPFDLERTTHLFDVTEDGGVQQVVSDDNDVVQIEAIRQHLRAEAAAFARGDFTDPAMIHGETMPGLDVLRSSSEQMTVTYIDIEAGGQISYVSTDSEVIAALHAWFAAQLSDHGAHATTSTDDN